MAEIEGGGGGKHKGGKKKGKKLSTRVDFTPMVDLGFLLITFFMLTTSMNKPQTMEINMPVKEKTPDNTKVKASQAITLLLAKDDKVIYYFINDKTGDPETPFITDFDSKKGIRHTLLIENKKRNPILDSIPIYKSQLNEGKIDQTTYKAHVSAIKAYDKALIVVIKAMDESRYKNLVDILDEMLICNIGRYAIVDITDKEKEMVVTATQSK
jgi:biopolymer transport protein ExbD